VVDDYAPVVAAWKTTSTRSRRRSSAATPGVTRRTYELAREVIEFQRATKPLVGISAG
jgi:magnesium transporter